MVGGIAGARGLGKAARGCKNSFSPSTLVLMADGGTRPISELKVGDALVATDPESGETTHEEVEFLHDNVDHDLVELAVTLTDGSTSTTQTTAEHPFWDDTEKAWTNAASLKPGTSLRTPDNKTDVTVSTAATFLGVRHMLNLTVANIHTYYVLAGTTPVLVHNCGGGVDAKGNPCSCAAQNPTNWNPNSRPTFGHTFSEHGAGARNTRSLTDRARSTGNDQGQ